MFEVLMYLFENYMDGSIALKADAHTIFSELEQAGFPTMEIGRALDWLDGLSRVQEYAKVTSQSTAASIRHYLPEEIIRLTKKGHAFLQSLEQMQILDSQTREVILDRIMALDPREVSLGRIKWIVLISLFNQPDKKSALSVLQDMILSKAIGVLH